MRMRQINLVGGSDRRVKMVRYFSASVMLFYVIFFMAFMLDV